MLIADHPRSSQVSNATRLATTGASPPTQAIGESGLRAVKVQDLKTGAEREIPVSGLFFAIGHEPNTGFLGGQLKLDETGYVLTTPGTTHTSVEGVFAAGDVQDKKYRQAVTAAGSGCAAALEAEHFLAAHPA